MDAPQRCLRGPLAIVLLVFAPAVCAAEPVPGEAGIAEAERRFASADWRGAAAAYGALAESHGGDGQYPFRQGVALLQLGELQPSAAALEAAARLGFQRQMALFLIAGIRARQEQTEEAWKALEQSVAAGFSRGELLEQDASLAPLRADARFATVVAAARANAAPCMHGEGYDELDFWVGVWDVFQLERKVATSSVERSEGGCLLVETYRQPGADARLFLYRHGAEKRWHAVYVDGKAGVGEYHGSREAGGVALEGRFWQVGRGSVEYRLVIKPGTDGGCEVIGESREPGTASWGSRYHLTYRRRAGSGA